LDGEFQQSNAALAVALCKEYLANALKQGTLPSSGRDKVERDLAHLASGEGLPASFKLGKTKSLADTTQTLTSLIFRVISMQVARKRADNSVGFS